MVQYYLIYLYIHLFVQCVYVWKDNREVAEFVVKLHHIPCCAGIKEEISDVGQLRPKGELL